MYFDMQMQVEAAWQQWQQEALRGQRSWEGVREEQPTLPTLNRKLIGCTERRHPAKDDRWRYEVDFDRMEQTNISTQTTRRIRRFGMTELTDRSSGKSVMWQPSSVGLLQAANGSVQT